MAQGIGGPDDSFGFPSESKGLQSESLEDGTGGGGGEGGVQDVTGASKGGIQDVTRAAGPGFPPFDWLRPHTGKSHVPDWAV